MSVEQFLRTPPHGILGQLTLAYSREGFAEMKTDTPVAWWNDLASLQAALEHSVSTCPVIERWWILLEFDIPRKGGRIDVVLLAGSTVVLLECKSSKITSEAFRQVETYALLLHYFHHPSQSKTIVPFAISKEEVSPSDLQQVIDGLKQRELAYDALPSYWIRRPYAISWKDAPAIFCELAQEGGSQTDGKVWDDGEYRPTPTILEAALALRTGLRVGEIAQSEAAEEDIEHVTQAIQTIISEARTLKRHSIIFLTGVPGSGKTLVGLSLAHLENMQDDGVHFMSGNGPLVRVLQSLFKKHAMQKGMRSHEATIQAKTLIEDVHLFAKEYTERKTQSAPSNHVVVFDEAQRAWDYEHGKLKFGREHSEPTMFLKIMERHRDWAAVVALVGGGQEINKGEAGLEEWGKALAEAENEWSIYASPEVIRGGPSTAGRRLFAHTSTAPPKNITTKSFLHLRTSNRSLRAENLAHWVNLVLSGNAEEAAALNIADAFPVFVSRNLNAVRTKLMLECLGESRYGLVGSSKAARLRAEGLEPDGSFHRNYPWEHWYLGRREDIRSSYACEVFATEFEVQGLELDWVGVCWGGDLIRNKAGWVQRKLWQGGTAKWSMLKSSTDQQYRLNAYRVLLTRARQGMILFVPEGDSKDATRKPAEMDDTADFLIKCGAKRFDPSTETITAGRPTRDLR